MARDPVKISKNLDDNALANELFVGISDGTEQLLVNADGSLNATINNAAGASAVNIQDGGNVISIDDAGGSITIDGAVTATSNYEYAEDSAHTTADTGAFILAVRNDAGTSLVDTDGDYAPFSLDSTGALRVTGSSTTINAEKNEDDAHVSGDTGNFVLAVRQDTLASSTSTDGDYAAIKVDAAGSVYTTLNGETVNISDNGGSITVDATDLDIRDLTQATDSVAIGDGTDTIDINADGSVNVTDNGGSLTIDNSTLAVVGGGTEATALRVTIANDSTGVVSIDDNGGSITVDGTVTVNATDLDIRDLSASQDNVAISDGTDTLAVNTDGSINVVTQSSSGTAVADYDQVAALASAASDNHDYTAAGGTFEPIRVEVSGESIGTFQILANAVVVGLVRTSVENPNAVFTFPDGFSIADTQVLRVVRTNDSNKAHAFDSTIIGYQN